MIDENPPLPAVAAIDIAFVPGVIVIPDPAVIPNSPDPLGAIELMVWIPEAVAVADIVIEPDALAIAMPLPAVSVAATGGALVDPMRS